MLELDPRHELALETAASKDALRTSLPAPLLDSLDRLHEEAEPGLRLQELCLSLIPMTFQYFALMLSSEYLHAESPASTDLSELLMAMIRRPGPGKWVAFIRGATSYFTTHEPQVVSASAISCFHDTLVAKNRPRVAITDGHGGRKKLDSFEALVNLRNRFAHSRKIDSETADLLISSYLQLWKALVALLVPVFAVRMVMADPQTGAPVALDRRPFDPGEAPEDVLGDNALVLWDPAGGRALPLVPLVILLDDEPEPDTEILMLEEMRGKNLLYLYRDHFVARKREYQHLLELLAERTPVIEAVSAEEMTLALLGERIDRMTRQTLTLFEDSLKYMPSMYVDRPRFSAQLDLWIESEPPGAIIVGMPGTGKTSVIADWCCRRREQGDHVLLLEAAKLASSDLSRELERGLGLTSSLREVFERVFTQSRSPDSGTSRFVIVIDGVNEFIGGADDDRSLLWREINSLVDRLDDYRPLFKCLVSTRSDVWAQDFPKRDSAQMILKQRLYFGTGGPGFPVIELGDFAPEEAERVWEKARASIPGMAPLTSWTELPASTRKVLENPFLLRLALRTYDGELVPVVSAARLQRVYAHQQALVQAEKRQVLNRLLERMMDLQRTEVSLDELLASDGKTRRSKKAAAAEHSLHEVVLDPRPQSPYRQLIHEGIVEERTVGEGEAAEERLSFAQEKITNLMDEEFKRERLREMAVSGVQAFAIVGIFMLVVFATAIFDDRSQFKDIEALAAASSLDQHQSTELLGHISSQYARAAWRLAGFLAFAALVCAAVAVPGAILEVMGRIWTDRIRGMDLPLRLTRDRLARKVRKVLATWGAVLTGTAMLWVALQRWVIGGSIDITIPGVVWASVCLSLTALATTVYVVARHARSPEHAFAFFGPKAARAATVQVLISLPMLLFLVVFFWVLPGATFKVFDPTSIGAYKEDAERLRASHGYQQLLVSNDHADRELRAAVSRFAGTEDDRVMNTARDALLRFTRGMALGVVAAVFILGPLGILAIWLVASPMESFLRR